MCERTTEIEKQVFFALFWLASIFWLSVVRSTELLGMESAERESVANMSNDTYTRRLSDRSQNRFIWGIWDFLDLPKKMEFSVNTWNIIFSKLSKVSKVNVQMHKHRCQKNVLMIF